MKHKIRILVAEDHLIARVGVTSIINMQPDMTVVAEAVNGQQALDQYRKHLPDVTLLDIRMPVMSGVETAVAIRAEYPASRLIALTTYDGDENIRRAISAGVRAYLTKDVRHHELVRTNSRCLCRRDLPAGYAGRLGTAASLPERKGDSGAVPDRFRFPKQADRVRVEYRGRHSEEPREAYSCQVASAGSDASRHGRDSAGHYYAVKWHPNVSPASNHSRGTRHRHPCPAPRRLRKKSRWIRNRTCPPAE